MKAYKIEILVIDHIAQQDQIDFSALSEEEQKEIGWFDAETLAKEASKREISLIYGERINKGDIDEQVKTGGLAIVTSGESLYKEGFQKALELLSDRRFTLEDMMDIAGFMAAADNKRPIAHLKEEAEEYIKRKKSQQSWTIEGQWENNKLKVTKIL